MRLSLKQIMEYQTKGYVVVPNALSNDDLQPVIDEIEQVVEERAQKLYSEGKIPDLFADEPFERRYALLHKQCPEIGRAFDIMFLRGEAMFQFLLNEHLLDIVECLLGHELTCNPIQHLRAKLPTPPGEEQPRGFENVPWHQDAAVTLEEADASEIITFWLPLVDATAETGCMELMPEAFKYGYIRHQAEGGTMIVPELLPGISTALAECPKGGIVIMNKYTPHRGTSNRSDIIRWSMDLRYHKTGAPSGRPFHPSFAARSRSNPQSIPDYMEWKHMWEEALQPTKQAHKMHRV